MHHASLSGDHETAAAAAVDAGQRCLRLFAYGEAMSVARRGLEIAQSVQTQMRLLEVIVMARVPVRERVAYTSRIADTMEKAREEGAAAVGALGAHLLACLYQESNDYRGAVTATVASAEMSRIADPATAAFAIANSARCLLFLQHDIEHAEILITQAEALGAPNMELSLAAGYLHAHHGRVSDAIVHLEAALELAGRAQDHWREWCALYRLATVAIEEGDARAALMRCARLRAVSRKMKGGSEPARAEALDAVARYVGGDADGLPAALDHLRAADSKGDLSWALAYLASVERDEDVARRYATEALEAAETVGRQSEAVIARCILGLPAKSTRDLTARAKRILKERKHVRSRTGAVV